MRHPSSPNRFTAEAANPGDLWIDRRIAQVWRPRDPEPFHRARHGSNVIDLWIESQGISWITAAHNIQHEGASWTVRLIGPRWEILSTALAGYCGMSPNEGLNPKIPQKPAGMRMDPAPSDPCDNTPIPVATAAGTPSCPPDLPGIVRRSEDSVARVAFPSQLGRVGLADHHRSSVVQSADDRGIEIRHPVFVQKRPTGRANTSRGRQVLDRDRNARQQGWVFVFREGLLGRQSLLECQSAVIVTRALSRGFARSVQSSTAFATSTGERSRSL